MHVYLILSLQNSGGSIGSALSVGDFLSILNNPLGFFFFFFYQSKLEGHAAWVGFFFCMYDV